MCSYISIEKYIKQAVSHGIKSIIRGYIKKQSLQVLSYRLVKLTNFMRFLKVRNESEEQIDLSSLDQMTGPK